jgi:hypothetical protein
MEITLNEDERYYLTYALQHAIKRVDQHTKKMEKMPDGGACVLSKRDADWLRELLECVRDSRIANDATAVRKRQNCQ